MASARRLLTLLAVAQMAGCLGCPGVRGSREYQPRTSHGRDLLKKARRDVQPADIRNDLARHKDTLVAWSGVVAERKVTPDGNTLGIVVEHHYWDWKEDFGAQRERVFLSPRGEGKFGLMDTIHEGSNDPRYLPVGSMAIVIGKPVQVTAEGLVVLAFEWSITVPKEDFATDIWDYGRAWLEKGDPSDLRVLRTF